MKLVISHFFDASHQLPDTPSLITKKCAQLHGHTYFVIVELEGKLYNGMVVDFKAVKNAIDVLDHRHINEVFEEHRFYEATTAENIARFIAWLIEKEIGITPSVVKVCEGYRGDFSSFVIFEPPKEEHLQLKKEGEQ